MKISIAVSTFNEMITKPMLSECLQGFKDEGMKPHQMIEVPGAFELPLATSDLCKDKPDAIIVMGCLIEGETDHYKQICDNVSHSLMKLSLEKETPIIFEVLMCDSYQKAEARIKKGYHAVKAAINTISARQALK